MNGDHRDPRLETVIEELERFQHVTDTHAPTSFSDQVMARVEREGPPRRGLLGWLGGSGGAFSGGMLRATTLAAVLVVAIVGTLAAAELAGVIRQPPVGTSPSVVAMPTSSPTSTPSATPAPSPTSSVTPTRTPRATPSHEASQTANPSGAASELPGPSASDDRGGGSGSGSGGGSGSPEPSSSGSGSGS